MEVTSGHNVQLVESFYKVDFSSDYSEEYRTDLHR